MDQSYPLVLFDSTASYHRLFQILSAGARTREGVRLSGLLNHHEHKILLLCRKLPRLLRPGTLYCPVDQQSEEFRVLADTILPEEGEKPGKQQEEDLSSSSSEEEEDPVVREERLRIARVKRLLSELNSFNLDLTTYPSLISIARRIERDQANGQKAEMVLKKAREVQSWTDRVEKLIMGQQRAGSQGMALITEAENSMSRKFLASLPLYVDLKKSVKEGLKAAGRAAAEKSSVGRLVQAVESNPSAVQDALERVRKEYGVEVLGKDHWLSVLLAGKVGDGVPSSNCLPYLAFLACLPQNTDWLPKSKLFTALRSALCPSLVSSALNPIQTNQLLNHSPTPLTQISSLGDSTINRAVSKAIIAIIRGIKPQGEHAVGVLKGLGNKKKIVMTGIKDVDLEISQLVKELRQASFGFRVERVEKFNVKVLTGLAVEADKNGYAGPELRKLHLRLLKAKTWKFLVADFQNRHRFNEWWSHNPHPLLISDMLIAAKSEALQLLSIDRTSKPLRKALVATRWLESSLAAFESLAEVEDLVSRCPRELQGSPSYSSLLSKKEECWKLFGISRFTEDALERLAGSDQVCGLDIRGSALAAEGARLQDSIKQWRARRLSVGTAELHSEFLAIDQKVELPERLDWLKRMWELKLVDIWATRNFQVLQEALSGSQELFANQQEASEYWDSSKSIDLPSYSEMQDWLKNAHSALIQALANLEISTDSTGDLIERVRHISEVYLTLTHQSISTLEELKGLSAACQRLAGEWLAWVGDVRRYMEIPGIHPCDRIPSLANQTLARLNEALELEREISTLRDSASTLFAAEDLLSRVQFSSPVTDWLSAAVEEDRALLAEANSPNLPLSTLLHLLEDLKTRGNFQVPTQTIESVRSACWSAAVRLLARWAAWPQRGGFGVPWLLLLEAKETAQPDLELGNWISAGLALAERILKEIKPQPTDVALTQQQLLSERLGRWARLRLLLPALPIALYEPMEQLRVVLETKFPGYKLSVTCSGSSPVTRLLTSSSVALPNGKPGPSVSLPKPVTEPVYSDRLSSSFKKRMQKSRDQITIEKFARHVLKASDKVPGLADWLNVKTVMTIDDLLTGEKAAKRRRVVGGDTDYEVEGEGVSFRDAVLASLHIDGAKPEELESVMLSEIPTISGFGGEDDQKYLERFVKLLLNVQQHGHADRILAKRGSGLSGPVPGLPVIRPPPAVVPTRPVQPAPRILRPLWSGLVIGPVRNLEISSRLYLIPLSDRLESWDPNPASPGTPLHALTSLLSSATEWTFEGSMGTVKALEHFAKLVGSGKRVLVDCLVAAALQDDSTGPLLEALNQSALAFVSLAPRTKLWLVPVGSGWVRAVLEIPSPVTGLTGRVTAWDENSRIKGLKDAIGKMVDGLELLVPNEELPTAPVSAFELPSDSQADPRVGTEAEEESGDLLQALLRSRGNPVEQTNNASAVNVLISMLRRPGLDQVAPASFESGSSLRDALRRGYPSDSTPSTSDPRLQSSTVASDPRSNESFSVMNAYGSVDSKGGHLGNIPCRFFNGSGCMKPGCRFAHDCAICRGPHSSKECPMR